MSLSEILQSLVESPNLTKLAAEVATARDQMRAGDYDVDADPVRLHESLVHGRAQLDRMQSIAASLVLVKAKAAREMREAKGELDDAYMHAANKKSVGFSDYVSAKEKDATFNAETVAETIAFRQAENQFRDVEAVTEFVRVVLRGCEGAHRDLETRIRLISLAGQLDR